MKRGFLLPDGCKDLSDVPKSKPSTVPPGPLPKSQSPTVSLKPLPPIIGEIEVPELITVCQLADLLKQKPFKIMADLMELKVMVTVNYGISFDVIAKVARKYGFTVRKRV